MFVLIVGVIFDLWMGKVLWIIELGDLDVECVDGVMFKGVWYGLWFFFF